MPATEVLPPIEVKPNMQFQARHDGTWAGAGAVMARAFAIVTHYTKRQAAHVARPVLTDRQIRIRWHIPYRPAMHQCCRADKGFSELKPQPTYDEPIIELLTPELAVQVAADGIDENVSTLAHDQAMKRVSDDLDEPFAAPTDPLAPRPKGRPRNKP